MKTTREGRRFLLAACLIGLAALNTGNNLIYLILSLMVSFMLMSLILLRAGLSGVSAGMVIQYPVFAGEGVAADVTLENHRRLPVYSLHAAVVQRGMAGDTLHCAVIPKEGRTRVRQAVTFSRRGMYGPVAMELHSSFPFGLFTLRRRISCAAGIVVYPVLRDVEGELFLHGGAGVSAFPRVVGSGEDLHSLREYQAGDDVRSIYWKASAKVDTLMVREFADYEMMDLTILVDNVPDSGEKGRRFREGSAEDTDDVFEKVVSLAASLARHYLDAGYRVQLISSRRTIPFGMGYGHFLSILDFLAVIGLEEMWEEPVSALQEGACLIVLGSKGSPLAGMAGGGVIIDASDL